MHTLRINRTVNNEIELERRNKIQKSNGKTQEGKKRSKNDSQMHF